MHHWTVALLINENKQILLTKRSNYTKHFPHCWTLPWWWKEEWETPEQTIIREIKEELWLDFTPTDIFMKYRVDYKWERPYAYRFLWDYSWTISIQEKESDWYAWFTYSEAQKLELAFDYGDVLKKLHEKNII